MNLNKVYLIGRLTQDPEARTTPTGQNVTTLRLATNRVWNDQASGQKREAVEYHTVIAWARLGEIASQYLRKGGMVMIEGRLQTRNWTGQDNVKRYMTEIVAENLQIGPRPAGQSAQAGAPAPVPAAAASVPEVKPAAAVADEQIPIIDENELTKQGVDEEEQSIKDVDLPF